MVSYSEWDIRDKSSNPSRLRYIPLFSYNLSKAMNPSFLTVESKRGGGNITPPPSVVID